MTEETKKEETPQTEEETKTEETPQTEEETKTEDAPTVEESKKEEKKEETKKEEKEEKKEVEVPKKFEKIVKEIEEMKVLDLSELVKILEKKFGVSASAPVAVVTGPTQGGGEAEKEEKSEYNIVLTAVGDKKIEVIKAVRDVTAKGLKESKDLVDAIANEAQVVKENVKKEEAEEIKNKFVSAGATVELK